jgi:hypothetical protein
MNGKRERSNAVKSSKTKKSVFEMAPLLDIIYEEN